MKNASSAAKTILSGGQFLVAYLYDITLSTGAAYHFTAHDTPLSAAVYPSSTPNTYLTGFTITRSANGGAANAGSTTQEIGLDAQEVDLSFAPAWDNPGGPPTIAGYSIVQAARLGLLDKASVLMSKLFMAFPSPGGSLDTSPGAVAWLKGSIADAQVTRFGVTLKLASDLLVLNQTQMPRNLYQASCSHSLYDSGCTLSKTTFTSTGTVSAVTSNALFTTNLTAADGYFDLGVIKFTSGGNSGLQATVKQYLNASGRVQTMVPLPAAVAIGDAFSIYPGCDHTQSTCTSKFSNLAHFNGMPYVPVTETLYDGSTVNVTPDGQPGGPLIGSGPVSQIP